MSADLASKIFIFSLGGLAFTGILLRAIADVVSSHTSKKLYRFLYAFCISLIILLPIGTCWWLYIVASPDLITMIFTCLLFAAIPFFSYRIIRKGL
jgi:hypothetical protein